MRVAAQTVFVVFCCFIAFALFSPPVYAQAVSPSPSIAAQTNTDNFLFPNTAADVPRNHHMYTQIELIDILSAVMCQLTGIDPTNPSQSCLGVDPTNGKIGFNSTAQSQQFAMASPSQPQLGGALGVMNQFIGSLYIPAVSSTQYVGYLADNFSLTKPAYAATNCNTSQFGYGFCGLSPLLTLWSDVRDLSYAMLTILFIAIGVGVMFRFRVDPRTVMTLQNQIPRVIIAILLITFSFAIAGGMIDIMWTATYAGVNFISNASPNSQINLCTPQQNKPQPLNQVVETRLIDQPISFTNTVFRSDPNCNAAFDNGLLNLATKVSDSLGDLVQQLVHDLLFSSGSGCHWSWWDTINPLGLLGFAGKCALQAGALTVILWLAEFLVKLIIVITILVALFRLWYKLITCYLTFLIFVILGPIWIVLGLIPGRPMGFEKWLRIIFANLAVFPLVAFILVFARVISDLVPSGPSTPNTVFVPPLVGNPSISTFSDLMAFGAIMIAPNIPDIIKERLKAKSQSNLGAVVGAGVAAGASIATAPGRKAMENLNRRNPTTGAPEGRLAIAKARFARNLPGVGDRIKAADRQKHEAQVAYTTGDWDKSHSGRQHRYDIKHEIPLQERMERPQENLAPSRRAVVAGRAKGVSGAAGKAWNRFRPGGSSGGGPQTPSEPEEPPTVGNPPQTQAPGGSTPPAQPARRPVWRRVFGDRQPKPGRNGK
jgi:hypothetical protein